MSDNKQIAKRRSVVVVVAVAILAAVAGLLAYYTWYSNYGFGHSIDRRLYPVNGIDISAHNGYLDFEKLRRAGVDFVFVKATEGASFKDTLFEANYENALKAGIPVSAYHFFRFDMNGTLQAMNFLSALKGKNFNLPVAIDVEAHGNPEIPAETVIERLHEMIDYIGAPASNIILYTNIKGYDRYLKTAFANHPLWICRFVTPAEHINWTFWQYTHTGEIEGADGPLDMDVFSGNILEFTYLLKDYTYSVAVDSDGAINGTEFRY